MWMTGHVVNVCVYLYLLGDEKEGRKKKVFDKIQYVCLVDVGKPGGERLQDLPESHCSILGEKNGGASFSLRAGIWQTLAYISP